MNEAPSLSVVIASVNGHHSIAQCLRSLEKQQGRDRVEVIVNEASGDGTARRIAEEFPWVRLTAFDTPRPIPRLRSLGIRQASAPVVTTTKDHCIFDPNWYRRILEAHETSEAAAIGGAVENGGCDGMVDWAAYLCEYGNFMLPFSPGPAIDLPGPNVSYKKQALEETCADLLDEGAWENLLHGRLAARGKALRRDPSIVVYHAKPFGFRDFLLQRYYFGRSYAASRIARSPWPTRALYVAVSPLLPPLFLLRYARRVIDKKRFVGKFLRALPLLAIFAIAWSVGEFFGYAFGDGGASEKVR